MHVKRTVVLLTGLLVVSSLGACATDPLREPSVMHNVLGYVSEQYEKNRCEKKSLGLDCSKAGRQERRDQYREKIDAKRIAKGELIPVEQLPVSLYQEPQSSAPANPDTVKISEYPEPSVVMKPEFIVN